MFISLHVYFKIILIVLKVSSNEASDLLLRFLTPLPT